MVMAVNEVGNYSNVENPIKDLCLPENKDEAILKFAQEEQTPYMEGLAQDYDYDYDCDQDNDSEQEYDNEQEYDYDRDYDCDQDYDCDRDYDCDYDA